MPKGIPLQDNWNLVKGIKP